MDKGLVSFSPDPTSGHPVLSGKHRRLSLDVISPFKILSSSTNSHHHHYHQNSKRIPTAPDLSTSMSRLASSQNDLLSPHRRSSQGDVSSINSTAGSSVCLTQVGVENGPSSARWARRRSSQADIMLRASQVDKLQSLYKKDKKGSSSTGKNKGQVKPAINKESYLLVEMEDGETVVLTCKDEHHMKTVLTAALMDRRVKSYRMVVASTRAVFKLDHGISRKVRSCEDLLDNVDGMADMVAWNNNTDRRFVITREFLEQEKHYCDNLQSLFDVYAEPLRKFSALSKEDHQVMFMPLEPLFSLSASLVIKLECVLDSWEDGSRRIGNLFSSKFWNYYQDYYTEYFEAKRLILEKKRTDASFHEFCELRRDQGRLPLEALLTLPVSGLLVVCVESSLFHRL